MPPGSFKVFQKNITLNLVKIFHLKLFILGETAMQERKKVNYSEIHQLNGILLTFRTSIIGFFLK